MNQINLTQWEEVQEMLAGAVLKSTYNAHIAKTTLVNYDGQTLTLLAPNKLSAVSLTKHLTPTIQRAAGTVYKNPDIQLHITAGDWEPEPKPAAVRLEIPPETPPPPTTAVTLGSGFTSLKSNFTTTPNGFFEELIANPEIASVTIRFIAAVIRHTLGVIDTKGNRQEWWENLTVPDICKAAGIKSRNSVRRAQAQAINMGWIKWRLSAERPKQAVDFAIRYEWEPSQEIDEKCSFFDF